MVAYTFYERDNRVRRYAEALALRGDEVEVIALRRDHQPYCEIVNGVRVYRIQNRTIDERGPTTYLLKLLLFVFKSAWVLAQHSLQRPYHLVHVHSVPDFEVFATIIPKLRGARIILDIHDIVPELYCSKFGVSGSSLLSKALKFVEKISCRYADHVIISNHLWQERLTKRSVRSSKCTAIINYPDLTLFSCQQKPTRRTDEFVLCYPGSLNQHQGVDIAIEALALLRQSAPQVKFMIVGDGPERERLKSLIKKHNLSDHVSFEGFVPLETIVALMSRIDLGVVPKRSDSFGNEAFSTKIMEFMAMGVPVLASRTRIDEYYFDEKVVHYFRSGDVADLASKILDLMHNPERRSQLRQNATQFIRRHNWGVKKHEYLALVDDLIKKA